MVLPSQKSLLPEGHNVEMEWSDLPPELVVAIGEKLTELTDRIRLCSVCSLWRFALRSFPIPPQLPWLVLQSDDSLFHFYSFSEDRIYPKIYVPDAEISYLYGSGNGWVLALKGQYPHVSFSIINPFIRTSITLPSPDRHCPLSYGNRDTLIWDCSDSVVVAACSTSNGIYYYRSGDDSWSKIKSNSNPSGIVYFSGKFYILNIEYCSSKVRILDKDTLEIEEISLPEPPCVYEHDPFSQRRIFVSSGVLLLLAKAYSRVNNTHFYKIYGADITEKKVVRWNQVSDIGDHALFIDNRRCILVKVSKDSKLRRNCIYSARSKSDWDFTRIMYSVSISITELGNIEGERPLRELGNVVSPPIWFSPSLNSIEM